MKALGYILGACVVLAIVRTMVLALALILMLAIVVGIIVNPRATLGLLTLGIVANVFAANLGLGLLIIALAVAASITHNSRDDG